MIYILKLLLYLLAGFLVLVAILMYDTKNMTLLEFRDYYQKNKEQLNMIILGWPIVLVVCIVSIPIIKIINSTKWMCMLYTITHLKEDKPEKKDNI